MQDVIEGTRDLKLAAIKARDKGEFEEAQRLLRRAESELHAVLEEEKHERTGGAPADFERKLAGLLVHTRGSMGGVLRRAGRHLESARAYDAGYRLEQPESGYRIVDSYTLVQRLVARVLFDPAAPTDERIVVEDVAVRRELEAAEKVIRAQTRKGGPREKDEYAVADLALVLLLLGNAEWQEYMRRLTSMTSGYAVTATREVLQDLHKAAIASPRASVVLRDSLSEALAMLAPDTRTDTRVSRSA